MTSYKALFITMGGWSQLLFLALISLVGLLITSILIVLVAGIFVSMNGDVSPMDSITFLKIAQTIQTMFWLALPAVLFATLFSNDPKSYLKIESKPQSKEVAVVIILFVTIQPFILLVSHYNQQIALPESMSSIEGWMRGKEADSKRIVDLFLADRSIVGVITNLLIVALLAGVAEELFFRGCVQQSITKLVYSKHVGIWITAIIFSAVHFQFFGFVPRLLLGALLGYLYLWSNNIWVPIVGHVANNAFYMIIAQVYYGTPTFEKLGDYDVEKYGWLAVLSFIISCVFLYFARKNIFKNKYFCAL